jgi:tetratricopeptide (TPR) repeat protein/peroxiredoxin
MRTVAKSLLPFGAGLMVLALWTGLCCGQVVPGQTAPVFSLSDLGGTTYNLASMKERSMVILYFFDASSRPSQEGLLSLDQLAKTYAEANLTVWGITLSPRNQTQAFLEKTQPRFPILLDGSGVSDLYQAQFVLPTVCILGPGGTVMDFFQGGGKTTEVMLVRLAERNLQQKQTLLAKAISDEVVKKDPQNDEARSVKGYAALKEGNVKEAAKTFRELADKKGQSEVLGKEGLAAVYAKEGKTANALALVEEVEHKAPERGYVQVVKGDILYAQNKKEEAGAAYQKAAEAQQGATFQKALAHNQLGRFNASLGKYEKARELYDQAIEIDPYYIEATSNKGMAYEKEGKWEDALEAYRRSLSVNKEDTFSAVLAKKAEEMVALQYDATKKERIDKLVKELAARYKAQKGSTKGAEDAWTSRPMILTFVDFREEGGLSERDGFSMVLTAQLADRLNASGRLQVVERVLMERLLEELNIGSSELADPETALKLGKVLAAKLVGTGTLYFLADGTLLTLRLIDTETSAIPKVVTRQMGSQAALEKELSYLNREVLKTIIEKYPLQGFVVQADGNEVLINLGSKQGVVLGTNFEAVEEQAPIKYKDKLLQSAPRVIGQVEIIRVEPDLSYGRVVKQERALKMDDKVREKLAEIMATGAPHGGS